ILWSRPLCALSRSGKVGDDMSNSGVPSCSDVASETATLLPSDPSQINLPPRRRSAAAKMAARRRQFADPRTIDVSVCIANWNCGDLLRLCLESLQDQPQGVSLEVIVVDNASTDGAPEMVAAEFPEVLLIRNSANLGFSKANNQAAEKASG